MKNLNTLYFRGVPQVLETVSVEKEAVLSGYKEILVLHSDTGLHKLVDEYNNSNFVYNLVVSEERAEPVFAKLLSARKTTVPYAIICDLSYFKETGYELALQLQQYQQLRSIPFIVVVQPTEVANEPQITSSLRQTGVVDDVYVMPLDWEQVCNRVAFLGQFKLSKFKLQEEENMPDIVQVQKGKRLFDILFSLMALIFFGPVMLLIAIAVKLESKGPVFYKSKRVGAGYRIFDFYKFRSMSQAADKELNNLAHLNQYVANEGSPEKAGGISFVKISNDPRVTKIGWFIRKTSLDELPQLFNVLKGDMSVVGNRPLPLYEAQQLTRDIWAKRFLAPAGITGLWQVTKRGKSNMSAEERIQLDNDYAQNCSFVLDMQIILKTLPAMLQKEAV